MIRANEDAPAQAQTTGSTPHRLPHHHVPAPRTLRRARARNLVKTELDIFHVFVLEARRLFWILGRVASERSDGEAQISDVTSKSSEKTRGMDEYID